MIPPRPFSLRRACLAIGLALAASAGQAAGLDIQADADGKDVGLPIYPGAVKRAESDGNSAAFSFGAWGGSFGIKMAVVSYRTADDVDAVARFYRDALARFGPVLDCSAHRNEKKREEQPRSGGSDKDKDKPVVCDNDGVEPGGRLYKVGVQRSQRTVQVEPAGAGADFTLVRIHVQGSNSVSK